MNPDELALWRACEAAPGDGLPLLILADWLDERGLGNMLGLLRQFANRAFDPIALPPYFGIQPQFGWCRPVRDAITMSWWIPDGYYRYMPQRSSGDYAGKASFPAKPSGAAQRQYRVFYGRDAAYAALYAAIRQYHGRAPRPKERRRAATPTEQPR